VGDLVKDEAICQRKATMINIEKPKPLLRVSEIISPDGLLPIGKSAWWDGVKRGIYPQPIKLGPRITVWRSEDIQELMRFGIERGPVNVQGQVE
jgi:predicted DNA-binding transcriptional regulator AlpA